MITYELAKELKDAGFPQNIEPDLIYAGEVPAQFPTLSELIEACGDDFEKLSHMTTGNDKWLAKGSNLSKRKNRRCFGSSPEEAVARLWLALNKPKYGQEQCFIDGKPVSRKEHASR